MTMSECYELLDTIEKDYLAMVRELNKVKKSVVAPVDPDTLPLIQRLRAGKRDLAIALGVFKSK